MLSNELPPVCITTFTGMWSCLVSNFSKGFTCESADPAFDAGLNSTTNFFRLIVASIGTFFYHKQLIQPPLQALLRLLPRFLQLFQTSYPFSSGYLI